jgi:hypothetical protein
MGLGGPLIEAAGYTDLSCLGVNIIEDYRNFLFIMVWLSVKVGAIEGQT